MTDWLPFLISGLVVGSIFAIAALGLVVTYRTTGLFSFAHGATGMAVAYGFHAAAESRRTCRRRSPSCWPSA